MNDNWNISGLILDGVCGTGKTTLFRALQQSEAFSHRSFLSVIALSEHQTQRVLERKERDTGLATDDNVALLDQHVSYLETVQNRLNQMEWCQNNRTNMRIPYLLERFHFTHVHHYNHMSWSDVEDIDRRLAELNCKLCLLTVDDSILADRIISGRNAEWRNYLSRYGETDDEILEYFAEQQKLLRALCDESELDTLIVDTTKASVEDTLDQVIKFWAI